MNRPVNLILLVVLFCFASCDKKRVFDEYKSVGTSWHKDSIVGFDLPELDAAKSYNLYLNVRDNDKYAFNNLFLIVSMEEAKGEVKVDTLEYEMTDAEGNLMGDGFSDIKENKLVYKENVRFPKGKYKVNIKQAVRQNGKVSGVEKLDGVTEVGFRIESTK